MLSVGQFLRPTTSRYPNTGRMMRRIRLAYPTRYPCTAHGPHGTAEAPLTEMVEEFTFEHSGAYITECKISFK
jgi:hypothetical protein